MTDLLRNIAILEARVERLQNEYDQLLMQRDKNRQNATFAAQDDSDSVKKLKDKWMELTKAKRQAEQNQLSLTNIDAFVTDRRDTSQRTNIGIQPT